jgi:RNA polymerase-interacting CarD/CdnL/TRCF family regulator
MSDKPQFRVGDKLVDYGQIHRIFKIKKVKIFNGDLEYCIFYKPFFETDKCKSLVCSIPESNVKEANLRRPVSKKYIYKTLRSLSKKPNGETRINISEADLFFKENDPVETAKLLKLLWLEKQDEERSLSTRKKYIFENAIRHLIEEISIVQKIGLKKAEMMIIRRLRRFCPEKPKALIE